VCTKSILDINMCSGSIWWGCSGKPWHFYNKSSGSTSISGV